MTFALKVQQSLIDRTTCVPNEFAAGHSLEMVLSRHLLAVESAAGTDLLTSILMLDSDGKRLWHAAAPSLPQSYCEAINGAEIGPSAGSCGTAAFLGHAVYVTDIATDPLWSGFSHLALPHGLCACWSTPIHDSRGVIVGTFAVYHSTPRNPTQEEVTAIGMIVGHVAQAIEWGRDTQDIGGYAGSNASGRTALGSSTAANEGRAAATLADSQDILRSIESDFQKLGHIIERAVECFPDADLKALTRAKQATVRGAAMARKIIKPN